MLEKGRENWKGYALAIFFMTLVAITTALSAWLMKDVINEIFIDRNAAMVAPIAGFIFVIFLVKGFSSYAQNVILARIGNGIIADLQMRIFDHVQLQRIDFYDKNPIGDITARFSHNASAAAFGDRTCVWSSLHFGGCIPADQDRQDCEG